MDEKPAEALAQQARRLDRGRRAARRRRRGATRWSRPATPARAVLACARTLEAHPRRAPRRARRRLPDRAAPRREGRSVLADPRRRRDGRRRPPRIWSPSRSWARPTRRSSRKNPRPRVALLSNGTEAGKGPPEVVEAHARSLKTRPSSTSSATSRASTSRAAPPTSSSARGFVGNVVLKMLEGVSETVVRLGQLRLQGAARCGAPGWRCCRAASSGSRRSPTGSSTAARRCSGSIGCSSRRTAARSARAITNAVKVAAKAVQAGLTDDIEKALRSFAARRAA